MHRQALTFIGSIVLAVAMLGRAAGQTQTGGELPRIEAEAFREITELLRLDQTGLQVAGGLYAQYSEAYQSARNAMGVYADWSLALNPWTFGAEDPEINRIKNDQWNRIKPVYHQAFIDLEEQFIADLAALSEAGREEVDALRRQRFRDRLFEQPYPHKSERIGGFRMDLVRMLDDLEVDWRGDAELRALIDAWDVQHFELLFRRTYEPAGADHLDWWKFGTEARAALAEGGLEAAERPLRRLAELATSPTRLSYQIRALNRRTADAALTLLPEAAAARLRERIDADFAPSIYQASSGIGAMEKALGLRDLSADQRANLDNLAEQYRLERRSAVERLLPLVDRLLTPEKLIELNMWRNNLVLNEEREYSAEKTKEHEEEWGPVMEQIEAWKVRDAQYLRHALRILTPQQRELVK